MKRPVRRQYGGVSSTNRYSKAQQNIDEYVANQQINDLYSGSIEGIADTALSAAFPIYGIANAAADTAQGIIGMLNPEDEYGMKNEYVDAISGALDPFGLGIEYAVEGKWGDAYLSLVAPGFTSAVKSHKEQKERKEMNMALKEEEAEQKALQRRFGSKQTPTKEFGRYKPNYQAGGFNFGNTYRKPKTRVPLQAATIANKIRRGKQDTIENDYVYENMPLMPDTYFDSLQSAYADPIRERGDSLARKIKLKNPHVRSGTIMGNVSPRSCAQVKAAQARYSSGKAGLTGKMGGFQRGGKKVFPQLATLQGKDARGVDIPESMIDPKYYQYADYVQTQPNFVPAGHPPAFGNMLERDLSTIAWGDIKGEKREKIKRRRKHPSQRRNIFHNKPTDIARGKRGLTQREMTSPWIELLAGEKDGHVGRQFGGRLSDLELGKATALVNQLGGSSQGNALVNHGEIFEPENPNQFPIALEGGGIKDLGDGDFEIRGERPNAVDGVEAVLPEGMVYSNDLELPNGKTIAQELRRLKKEREKLTDKRISQERKFENKKRPLTALQGKTTQMNIENINRQLQENQLEEEAIKAYQPEFPEGEKPGVFQDGGWKVPEGFDMYLKQLYEGTSGLGLTYPSPTLDNDYLQNIFNEEGDFVSGFTSPELEPTIDTGGIDPTDRSRKRNYDFTFRQGRPNDPNYDSFGNYIVNDPYSYANIGSGAAGLAKIFGAALTPVEKIDYKNIPLIGRQKEVPTVDLRPERYLGAVSPTQLSGVGMSPQAINAARADAIRTFSDAYSGQEVTNAQIKEKNRQSDMRRRMMNARIAEENRRASTLAQIYEDRGQAKQASDIIGGVGDVAASVIEILGALGKFG